MSCSFAVRVAGAVVALAGLFAVSSAEAQTVQDPPKELAFLSSQLKVRKNVEHQIWNELTFPAASGLAPVRGQHWVVLAEPADGKSPLEWAAIKPAFVANGWMVVKELPGGPWVVHYKNNGVETWAKLDIGLYPPMLTVNTVEVEPVPFTLTLTPPAETPEKLVAETGDFPYLNPMPGSKFHAGRTDTDMMWVTPKGAQQQELVATGRTIKTYDFPEISVLLLDTVYRDAFTKGGWQIVEETAGTLHAHYSQKGRNIWAIVGPDYASYQLIVADGGKVDLATSLKKDCHVALNGVFFDFNKATLQPASDGPLQQVADMMKADPALKLEVQGHTDNVGGDAYNQTLSEARAQSVVAWLGQHGVAAARLTARGYGKTKPIADNGTDVGRAKNRRVEIVDQRCTAAK